MYKNVASRFVIITVFVVLFYALFPPQTAAQSSLPTSFTLTNRTLTVQTPLLELKILDGALVSLKSMVNQERFFQEVIPPSFTDVPENMLGFTSKDTQGNILGRWPSSSSQITFAELTESHGRLTYTGLDSPTGPTSGSLLIDITVDIVSGEIELVATGMESDQNLQTQQINLPVLYATPQTTILGSGSKYQRNEPSAMDQTSYPNYGLNSPSVVILEGVQSVFGIWLESTDAAPDHVILHHKPDIDHLALTSYPSPRTAQPKLIISHPMRIGNYPSWVAFAKRWQTRFETRTGIQPLWNHATPWVRNIHATFDGTNNWYFTKPEKYVELASLIDPNKLLFFIWNGDRIVLYGDQTLLKNIPRPTQTELTSMQPFHWPTLIYHPYTLIQSPQGQLNRLIFLENNGWLPDDYVFTPDFPDNGTDWNTYWTLKTAQYDTELNIIHPGFAEFKAYLIRNVENYINAYQAAGVYFDILGGNGNQFFDNRQQVVFDQDYIEGERQTLFQLSTQKPHIGIMSEYQTPWVLPYIFYSWEGTETHSRQNQIVGSRLNHPLRVALLGKYFWAREDNEKLIDYRTSALMGALPQVSLDGDYLISSTSAALSQARAKLFADKELFNDTPDSWQANALAYYRSNTGNWFTFSDLGDSYAYTEELSNGTIVNHLRFTHDGEILSSPQPSAPHNLVGDFNQDGIINEVDVVLLINNYQELDAQIFDIDADQKVTSLDAAAIFSSL